jgi:hypothetical protein
VEELEEREVAEERRPYRQQRGEKDEKDEKQHEKDEKHTRDPLSGIFWGLILIMIGAIYFAHSQNYLQEADWWDYVVLGLGIVFLLEAFIRGVMPEYRGGAWGRVVPGLILTLVGLYLIYGLAIGTWWPIILIAAGLIIILGALVRGRRAM